MVNRLHDDGRIDEILRHAESAENLAHTRGWLELAQSEFAWMTPHQRQWYDVLAREFRQRMDDLLQPRRFWLRPPLTHDE